MLTRHLKLYNIKNSGPHIIKPTNMHEKLMELELRRPPCFTLQRNVFIVIRQIICMAKFVVCLKTETFTFLLQLLFVHKEMEQ